MKKCSRCKEEKEEVEFCKNKQTKDGLNCYCALCRAIIKKESRVRHKDKEYDYRKKWQVENKDKVNSYAKKYRKNHSSIIASIEKKYRNNHIERYRLKYKAYDQRDRDNLKRSYIASIICKNSPLQPSDIPPELIEVKRLIIKTKRLCKQQSQTSQNLETV